MNKHGMDCLKKTLDEATAEKEGELEINEWCKL